MMEIHDSHFANLRADSEGIWFEMETDTGEKVEGLLTWRNFHHEYQRYLESIEDESTTSENNK